MGRRAAREQKRSDARRRDRDRDLALAADLGQQQIEDGRLPAPGGE